MTINPSYANMLDGGHIQNTVSLASTGTTMVVANSDLETLTTEPLDPWNAISATGGAYDNIRPIAVPDNYLFVDVYWAFKGIAVPATSPGLRIYGMLQPPTINRIWPEDVDPTNYETLRTGIAATQEDFWIPLDESASGGNAISFVTAIAAKHTAGTKDFSISSPVSFPLAGVRSIILTVETASTAGFSSMALVRFSA